VREEHSNQGIGGLVERMKMAARKIDFETIYFAPEQA
jgi:hypothetical protein